MLNDGNVKKKISNLRRVTSPRPLPLRVLCDVTAEPSRNVNLDTRYMCTCVGAECGKVGGVGGKEQKISGKALANQ